MGEQMAHFKVIKGPGSPLRKHLFDDRTVKAPVTCPFLEVDDQKLVQRTIVALRRGPIRYHRNQVIVCEGDPADYIFLVLDGIVRSCRTFQNGTRSIAGFYLPGELFGWTDQNHLLSAEAATNALVLYLKRSALLAVAAHDSRIASFLLAATTNELRRTQEHALLMSRSARCRVATFLLDLSKRLGTAKYLDLPMSHQDIADHLGLTIETVSRTITELERSELIARISPRTLVLLNRASLLRFRN
jgi:CRP/FNR family transcriptional regulator, nitrogen fixation regulation protein